MSNKIIDTNGIIRMHRGDSFSMPITINTGDPVFPNRYDLQEGDTLYVGVMEPNCYWEHSIIRKSYDMDSEKDSYGNILFKLTPEETEFLLPGTYYYCVKLLLQRYSELGVLILEEVTTVVPKTLFYIM